MKTQTIFRVKKETIASAIEIKRIKKYENMYVNMLENEGQWMHS